MKNKEQILPNYEQEAADKISKLSGVFSSRDKYGRHLFFVGWSNSGLPMVTQDASQLTRTSRDSYESAINAGIPVRAVNFSSIEPVEYRLHGDPIDYKDQAGFYRTEDQMVLHVTDSDSLQKTMTFGEVSILEAIINSQLTWQDIGPVETRSDLVASASQMYTLLIPNKDGTTATAVMFRPTLGMEEGNDLEFTDFARKTLGQLVLLDEIQEAGGRKGYVSATARICGMDPIENLKKLFGSMFVDVDEQWLDSLEIKVRKIVAKVMGLIYEDVDVAEAEMPHSRYDIEKLNRKDLDKLTKEMLESVRTYFDSRR